MLRRVIGEIICIGLLAAVATIAVWWWSSPRSRVPIVVLPDGDNYDYGTIDEHKFVSHSFRVRNDGRGHLQLSRIIKNCACIEAKIGKKRLLPGEETEVTVGYSGNRGGMSASVAVQTNDPSRQWFNLTMAGVVKRRLDCYPGAFTFWNQDTAPQRVHMVVSKPASEWRVESSMKWIDARMVEDEDGYSCVVSLNADCPGGTWGESVVVTAIIGSAKETIIIPVLLKSVRKKGSGPAVM